MEESVSIEIQTPMQKIFYIWFLSVNQYYKSGHCATILVSQTWSERGRFELIQFWISYDGVVVFVMKFSTFFKLLKLAMDILHCKNEIYFFNFFFQTITENSPVLPVKMGGKRGKQKTETDETMAVEPMATDETSITVDDMKENGIENGAKLDTVSSKKHLTKPTVRRQFLKN